MKPLLEVTHHEDTMKQKDQELITLKDQYAKLEESLKEMEKRVFQVIL